LSKYIEEFLNYTLASGLSLYTHRNRKYVLRALSKRVPDVTCANIDELVEFLTEKRLSPTTLFGRYNVLVPFYKWLEKNCIILLNPMGNVNRPKLPKALPKKIMTKGEVIKMLHVYPNSPADEIEYRNRIILELLYTCSLRRSELVGLDVEDFEPSTRVLRIKRAKNNHGRLVPVGSFANDLLKTYISTVRGNYDSKALLLVNGERIKVELISELARKTRKKAGIRTKATSHSFRKSSATHMLKNGASIHSVKELLGHLHLSSTMPYTKIYPDDLVKMHKAFHPRERHKNVVLPKLEINDDFTLSEKGHYYPRSNEWKSG